MFRLRDNTRRRICRTAFVLLGILPTAGVALWCVGRHLPGRVAGEAQRLRRELGLEVSLEGLQYLRPGRVLYEGLELADPETGAVVLQCPAVEAGWGKATDQQGRPKGSLVLIASQPEIPSGGIDRLAELLDRVLRSRTGGPQFDVRLAAGQLTLDLADGPQTLSQVQGSVESFAEGARAEAGFRLAGVDSPQPIRIRVIRNRQITPPATGLELDTGGGAVPCDLLAVGLPLLGRLGPRSRLRGYIWASRIGDGRDSAGWDGELTGQLMDVDLDCLLGGDFPHRLSGTAQVTVQSARFHRQRLEEACATMLAGPGLVSRGLIEAAVKQLGLVPGRQPQTPGDLVPYGQLAMAATIDSRGIQLRGLCSGCPPGTILADRQGQLLGEPPVQPQPVAALLRTIVPESQLQVPATRQTDWLIGHLPVPEVVPPATIQAGRPQARLRPPPKALQ